MRHRGEFWQFFTYDSQTKYVSCNYCSKRYKKNATRMQEHLTTCESFRTDTAAGGPDYQFRVRPRTSSDCNDSSDQVSIENISTSEEHYSQTLNCGTDLISVEHGYNSENTTVKSSERSSHKKRMKDAHINNFARISQNRPSHCVPHSDECRDEFDIFGEHVANELRKLKQNPLLLANTKHELNNILHKSVIENYKNDEYVSVFIN